MPLTCDGPSHYLTEGEMLHQRRMMIARDKAYRATHKGARGWALLGVILGGLFLWLGCAELAGVSAGCSAALMAISIGMRRIRAVMKEGAERAKRGPERCPSWGGKKSRGWHRVAKVVPLPKGPKRPPILPQPPPRVIYRARGDAVIRDSDVKCDWADMGRLIEDQTRHCAELAGFDEECKGCVIGRAKRDLSGAGFFGVVNTGVEDPVGHQTHSRTPGDLFMRNNKIWIWTGREWRRL